VQPGNANGHVIRMRENGEEGSATSLHQAFRCPSGQLLPALTSPSEKLVWRSFTFGRLIRTRRANWEKASRSLHTTCSWKVPVPLM
jgi:hypothetical protein